MTVRPAARRSRWRSWSPSRRRLRPRAGRVEPGEATPDRDPRLRRRAGARGDRLRPGGVRDGDPLARPRGGDHDPLRRRLRAVDRRRRGRGGGRAHERLVLLRQRDRVAASAPPRSRSAAATGSGGTTATGPTRCAPPPWSAPGRSRSRRRRRRRPSGSRSRSSASAPTRAAATRWPRRSTAPGSRLGEPTGERGPAGARRPLGPGAGRPGRGADRGGAGGERRLRSLRALGAGGYRTDRARRDEASRARTAAAEAGLVAAVRRGEEPPTWVVTGVDAAGVEQAAAAARGRARRPLRARRRSRTAHDARCPLTAVDGMRSPLAYAPRPGPARRRRRPRRQRLPRLARRWSRSSTRTRSCSPAPVPRCSSPACWPGAGARWRAAARWGVALGVLIVAVNAIASQRGDTILLRGGDLPVLGPGRRQRARRSSRARCSRCGSRSCSAPSPSTRPASTPIGCCACCARCARHSALTATLITRLVPLAAADHARLREAPSAARPGRGAGRPRRRSPAGWSPARSTARSTSPRRSSCAATRAGVPRRAAPPAQLAPRLALRRRGRGDRRRSASAARLAGVGGFEAYPTVAIDARPGDARPRRRAAGCSPPLPTSASTARAPRWRRA